MDTFFKTLFPLLLRGDRTAKNHQSIPNDRNFTLSTLLTIFSPFFSVEIALHFTAFDNRDGEGVSFFRDYGWIGESNGRDFSVPFWSLLVRWWWWEENNLINSPHLSSLLLPWVFAIDLTAVWQLWWVQGERREIFEFKMQFDCNWCPLGGMLTRLDFEKYNTAHAKNEITQI